MGERSAETDAPDDVWCCRTCHMLSRSMAPLLPGEPEPRVAYSGHRTPPGARP